ncbi:MAG: 3-isopropylmalate dehydratase small subunit [Synergistaceae bacterium]|nr:3-isopropylmalate dehydratase small subunit [Synergistota bacterium]NLM70479.1 3-isopropylmalate dehydratase small subunit [Synergistaceae bacterium]
MNKVSRGRAWVFGEDVDTDVIIPARRLVSGDEAELGRYCMEDEDPEFAARVSPGDIIVAGENFGCGSSREHAPLAIRGAGCSCVIASSFARIFFRNAINTGLPIFECPEAVASVRAGDEIEADPTAGVIVNMRSGETFPVAPFPTFLQQLVKRGGLAPYVREELARRRQA